MGGSLRFGIAGLGNAGHQVLPYFQKVAGVELAAIADTRKAALDSLPPQYKRVRTFESVAELCQCQEVDAVWIATPNEFHAEHAVVAANHGKHMICEKPMAVTLQECDRMIEASENNKVTLLVHSKANDPPVGKIGEIISSGRLGRLIQVNTWNYKGWLRSARLPSEVDTTKGGGVVFRQGSHQVDIVRHIGGGRVTKVRGIAGKWNRHFDTEGNFTALLEFEDGTPATLIFNGYGFFDMTEMTWGIGESGTKVSKRAANEKVPTGPLDPSERYAMPRRSELRKKGKEAFQPFFGLTLVSCEGGDIRQSPEGLFLYTDKGRQAVHCTPYLDRGTELLNLFNAVNGRTHVSTDGKWGKATLEVLLAILRSSREGREITLSHQMGSQN